MLASCSSGDDAPPEPDVETTPVQAFTQLPPTHAVGDCGPRSGTTITDGTLTIGTDYPAYEPWFADNDPANGGGYEGAVARGVAQKLGYAPEQVTFVSVPFDEALAPGEKRFDFDINQVTILDQRRESVDFSSPYYAVAQSVIALEDSPAADAQSLADLAPLRLGAQAGSTSLTAIEETIRPHTPAAAFPTTDAAKQALVAGEVDAIVVDIPTGFQIAESQIDNATLVGQFPRPNAVTEFFGLVLERGSPLTPCVSAAVDSLYADGALDSLADEWITDTGGAQVLN